MSVPRVGAVLAVVTQLVAAGSTPVALVTFDGVKSTTFDWKEPNDPAMGELLGFGGQSSSKWSVGAKFGVFDGEVKEVPVLKVPGLIKVAADGNFSDVSDAVKGDLVLTVRSNTPEYEGFSVSFASGTTLSPAVACSLGGHLPGSRGCFKANFKVPAGDFTDVRIPFQTFSDKWNPANGEQTKTCAKDGDVCPTAQKLAQIRRVELSAQGVLGKVHLEVKSIAVDATHRRLVAPPVV